MGGMHGMGRIHHEANEPVFHEAWEGRVYALTRVVRGRDYNLDRSRHLIELLPPADYLRMSYYERWFTRMVNQLLENGVVTQAELDSGQPAPGSEKATPAVTAAAVPGLVTRRNSARRDVGVKPRFNVGQRVRARNIHPTGHTRDRKSVV